VVARDDPVRLHRDLIRPGCGAMLRQRAGPQAHRAGLPALALAATLAAGTAAGQRRTRACGTTSSPRSPARMTRVARWARLGRRPGLRRQAKAAELTECSGFPCDDRSCRQQRPPFHPGRRVAPPTLSVRSRWWSWAD